VIWNDPALALPWALPPGGPILSAKDKILPMLVDLDSPFDYDGVPLEPIDA
jgi:dTDP-4-dehydrorhamnose 3,5-epimerase